MGYWIWYLLIAVLAWAFKLPWLALLALLVFFARRHLADPIEWARTFRAVRELRGQVAADPANLLARRALARVYLGKHRAGDAARLLVEVIAKGMRDPEVFYLLGLARLRAGDPAGAIEPIVRSVTASERLLLGDPYFTAARALVRLERYPEAEDALDRGLAINSSRVDGYVHLARVRARQGNRAGAREAYRSAVRSWRESPDYLRWKFFGSYVLARWGALTAGR